MPVINSVASAPGRDIRLAAAPAPEPRARLRGGRDVALRGRTAARVRGRRGPHRDRARPAWWRSCAGAATGRRSGCSADMDALPIVEETGMPYVAHARPHARLRPRRPHRDAAGRGALPRRDPQLRRHRRPDLPAGRGRRRRRRGSWSRRGCSTASRSSGSSACTTGPGCRSAASPCAPGRPWPRPTTSRSP